MLKSTLFCVMALLCLRFCGFAQTGKATDLGDLGLQVGQQVPNVSFEAYNYKNKNVQLSDFKGKLLILDFWATWCSPCLGMIPRMDSLQKAFGDQIQFLSVTYQKKAEVIPFLEKLAELNLRNSVVPVVTDDSVLRPLFPHKLLPHYVWIDGSGKVRAFTGLDDINEGSIRDFLLGTGVLKQKKDLTVAHDRTKPFLVNGNGGDGRNLLFHSVLTGYTEGLNGAHLVYPPGEMGKRMTFINLTARSLFMDAFLEDDYISLNRVSTQVEDTEPFSVPSNPLEQAEWRKRFTYCYEQIIPSARAAESYALMRADLMRYFPQYQVSVEFENRLCYVLVKTKGYKKLIAGDSRPSMKMNPVGFTMKNVRIKDLITRLNVLYWQSKEFPAFDGTGIGDPVDIEVSAKMNDVASVNKGLEKYGLEFRLEKRKIKILRIRDKPGYDLKTK